jgi:hypothetical protein
VLALDTYVSIAYNLSVSISLYALAMFWVATHDDLKPVSDVSLPFATSVFE